MDQNGPKMDKTLSKISKISKYDHINPPKELSSEAGRSQKFLFNGWSASLGVAYFAQTQTTT